MKAAEEGISLNRLVSAKLSGNSGPSASAKRTPIVLTRRRTFLILPPKMRRIIP